MRRRHITIARRSSIARRIRNAAALALRRRVPLPRRAVRSRRLPAPVARRPLTGDSPTSKRREFNLHPGEFFTPHSTRVVDAAWSFTAPTKYTVSQKTSPSGSKLYYPQATSSEANQMPACYGSQRVVVPCVVGSCVDNIFQPQPVRKF